MVILLIAPPERLLHDAERAVGLERHGRQLRRVVRRRQLPSLARAAAATSSMDASEVRSEVVRAMTSTSNTAATASPGCTPTTTANIDGASGDSDATHSHLSRHCRYCDYHCCRIRRCRLHSSCLGVRLLPPPRHRPQLTTPASSTLSS